jgi:hypothetical protein
MERWSFLNVLKGLRATAAVVLISMLKGVRIPQFDSRLESWRTS